ncbi:LysR substrate-binding domain-containing protein [Caulobacter hibisci]|uniref:LysR family transcriptional regulator n=1 Tax=Caulobacter hibisci TaxID=2035993 RepID=A0ABS0SYH2_9CAUL|nr:LysR substrate-binding domain-containing protein [Caulobacter hibisci]MBI1684301.1 LysR family transcriptional regulator [Caulobacter hibisci]
MIDMDPEHRAASLSFRQLKLFESVGRLCSVRRASEDCNLSQPAVTQALAKLEQQIGAVLLERRASGSYLNELGEIFHRRTTRLFEQFEQALVLLGVAEEAAPVIAKRISRSQARSLIAIVESGSFAQAAQSLELSQASLQRAARDLEGNLKKSIYYRTAAGVMVTPAGVEFGRRIKLATQEIEWGIQEIEAARGSVASQIAIGAMPFGGSMLLASVLDAFVQANPKVDVKIVNESASEMLKRLRDGEVDFVIGLVQETTADDLVNEALARTPYTVVARRGHKLARQGEVRLEDLLQYDWVVGTPGASRRACFERMFEGGPGPKTSIATSALPIVRHLLLRSDRLALMTSYEVMHESDLIALPYGPVGPAPAIGVTTRAGWLPTGLHQSFIDLLRRHTADTTTPTLVRQAG